MRISYNISLGTSVCKTLLKPPPKKKNFIKKKTFEKIKALFGNKV